MILRFIGLCSLILLLSACNVTKKTTKKTTDTRWTWTNEISDIITMDSTFRTAHTGLLVREIGATTNIVDIKSDQYFTPASNTKLLTFYTAINVLDDRLVGMKTYETEDSIIIWGTGDPSFLNPFLKVNDFISERLSQSNKTIYYSSSNFQNEHYGSGWSWDDYNYGYQSDIHALPMYGNMVNFSKPRIDSELGVTPVFFKTLTYPNINRQKSTVLREEHSNIFYYDYAKLKGIYKVNRYVPYLTSDILQARLLSEHLGREVRLISSQSNIDKAEKIKTVQTDSLYQLLLQPSDNFVAEQLLLNCGSTLFDTLNTRKVIEWSMENLLSDLPHDYQWVDGSGLSRYNMTTPGNMVKLLELIHSKVEQERLFRLLPTGGESGTIRNLYSGEQPFVHAKTGSLRNNHSLSGYLIGDSGKVYVFSFMNSNYLVSNTELKGGMDKVLRILKRNL